MCEYRGWLLAAGGRALSPCHRDGLGVSPPAVVGCLRPLTRVWRVFCVLPGQGGFGGGVFPLHGRCGGLVVGLGDRGFVPGVGVCSDGGEGTGL